MFWKIDSEKLFSESEKKIVRAGALKVLRDEPNCKSIDTGYRTGDTAGAYYVTCISKNDGNYFNVWFTSADVSCNVKLAIPNAYSEDGSRKKRIAFIQTHAMNSSTVKIGPFGYATDAQSNNGRRTVLQDFKASNKLGVEQKLHGECLVLPNGKTELYIR